MFTTKITIVDNAKEQPEITKYKGNQIPRGTIFRGFVGKADEKNEQGGSERGPYLVCYSCVLDLSDPGLTWDNFGEFAPTWTILEVLDAKIIIRSKR